MKKILIVSVLVIFCCLNVLGQCTNPDCGEDFEVCGVVAELSVTNATTGFWSALLDGVPLIDEFTPNITLTEIIVTIGAFSEPHMTYQFVWHDDSGPCNDTVAITFARMPVASVGITQLAEVCGMEFIFNADTLGYGWAEFEWSSPYLYVVFSDASLPNSEVIIPNEAFGDIAHVSIDFVWTATNLACYSTDTMYVTFYQRPVANAGLDDAICGNQYVFGAEFSIPESENYTPSGVWYGALGPVGESCDINSIYNNNSEVTVSGIGIWRFFRRENNSMLPSCFSIDTVQIEFVEIPVIYAGEDKDVCGPCAQLEGVSAGFGGSWMPNGADYDDYSNQNTEACVNVYGPKSFVWLESNSALTSALSCTDLDTVVITFWRIPTANILTDEADSTACGLTFDHLRAENPGTGIYGHWWTENPAVIFTPLNLETSVTVPSYGYHDFYWIEESGPEYMPNGWCADTAGPLTIHFLNEHPIYAGFDHDVFGYECQLEGSSVSETNPYTDCTYFWNAEDVLFDDSHDLQANISVSEYAIYELVLYSSYVNMSSCTASDTVNINFRDPIYIGVNESAKGDFEVFPNPAGNYITILSDKIINSVQIFDINGKLLKSVSENYEDIDISDFGQGMYFILINTEGGVLKKRFVRF